MRKTILVAAVVVVTGFSVAGCDLGSGGQPNIQGDVSDSGSGGGDSHRVTYEVTGTAAKVDITYSNDGMGGSSQQNGVGLPWKKSMTIPSQGFDVYSLDPQNLGESGTVTCKITVDGKLLARQSSSGGYAITSCTANLGT